MICNVKDIPVYYEEYGEGKPVLCLHGCWVDHRLMTGCLEPFFNKIKGFRRIYLDYAGMGKTPASSWIKSADDMLELIKIFIEQIIPDENFLIIGESYGGYFSLGLILDIKEKIDGIMLICPDIHTKTLNKKHPVKQTIWKSDQFKLMENDTDVDAFLDKAVIATPEIYEKFKNYILSGIKMADVGFLKNYGYAFTFEDELETIDFDKPVCILTGRQDHVVGYHNAYEILDRFPRAAFSVLDCAGHNLQNEIGPLFNEHIRNWLWRIELFSNKS